MKRYYKSFIPARAQETVCRNAAGARIGYGRTPEEAHVNAEHWINQAPYARAIQVTREEVERYVHEHERELHEIQGAPQPARRATVEEWFGWTN